MTEIISRLAGSITGNARFTIIGSSGPGFTYLRSIPGSEYRRIKKKDPDRALRKKRSFYRRTSRESVIRAVSGRNVQIRRKSGIITLSLALFTCCFVLITVKAGIWSALSLGILFLYRPVKLLLLRYTGLVSLYYRVDVESGLFHAGLYDKTRDLTGSDFTWFLSGRHSLGGRDGTEEAGTRLHARFTRELPSFLYSSLAIPGLRSDDTIVHFFPDFLYVRCSTLHLAVEYRTVDISYREILFHETEYAPEDSRVTGYRWLHSRKDGRPDRRFKNNRETPIMVYGLITASAGGLTLFSIMASDTARCRKFASFLGKAAGSLREEKYEKKKTRPGGGKKKDRVREDAYSEKKNRAGNTSSREETITEDPLSRARAVLGVAPQSDISDIKAAYRRLVKIHHPDTAARTGNTDVYRAVERMKEINAAYSMLIKHVSR